MAALLYMGIAMLPRQMKMNLFLMLGTMMVFRGGVMAYAMGAMVHAGMSVVFGLIHVAILSGLGQEGSVGVGLLLGLIHWVIVGMGLGMIPSMHQLMRAGQMQAPGVFALRYPLPTAMGFLMLHLVFGVVVSVLYEAFI